MALAAYSCPTANVLANTKVSLHAAVVYGAFGMLDQASKELQKALRHDQSLAKNEAAEALHGKLGKK